MGLYHNYAEEMSDKVLEMVVCIFFVHNLKNSVVWLLKGETLVRACVDPSAKICSVNFEPPEWMQSQHNYSSCLKGKEPILTMAMQMVVVVGGGGGGAVEQWSFSVGEMGFLLWVWKALSSGNNSSLLNLVFLLTLTLFNSLILPLRGKPVEVTVTQSCTVSFEN